MRCGGAVRRSFASVYILENREKGRPVVWEGICAYSGGAGGEEARTGCRKYTARFPRIHDFDTRGFADMRIYRIQGGHLVIAVSREVARAH